MRRTGKVILLDKEQHILVLTRSDTHPKWPLHIDFPGGIIEESEEPAAAVIREIEEECQLSIDPEKLKLVTKRTTPGGVLQHVFFTQLRELKPTVTLSWEHANYEWMTVDELKSHPKPMGSLDDLNIFTTEQIKKMISADL